MMNKKNLLTCALILTQAFLSMPSYGLSSFNRTHLANQCPMEAPSLPQGSIVPSQKNIPSNLGWKDLAPYVFMITSFGAHAIHSGKTDRDNPLNAHIAVEKTHDCFFEFYAIFAALEVLGGAYGNQTAFVEKTTAPFPKMAQALEAHEWTQFIKTLANATNALKDPSFGLAVFLSATLGSTPFSALIETLKYGVPQIEGFTGPFKFYKARIYYFSDLLNSLALCLDPQTFGREALKKISGGTYTQRRDAAMSLMSSLRGFIRIGAWAETLHYLPTFMFRATKNLRFTALFDHAILIQGTYDLTTLMSPSLRGTVWGAALGAFTPYALKGMGLNVGGSLLGPALGAAFGALDTDHALLSGHTLWSLGLAQVTTYFAAPLMSTLCTTMGTFAGPAIAATGPLGVFVSGLAYGACMAIPALVGSGLGVAIDQQDLGAALINSPITYYTTTFMD